MYAWIWRRLPYGLPGKLAGSFLIVSAVLALLWFWGFPAAEPLLPFDDVNVSDQNGGVPGAPVDGGGGDPGMGGQPDPNSESPPPDDVIPYSTTENEPAPR